MKIITASILLCTRAFAANIPEEFTAFAIVPDILPKAPNELLSVTFKDSTRKEKNLQFGEELLPIMVKDPPCLAWLFEDSSYYTVVMIDSDAPSNQNPIYQEMLHWLVTNILCSDISKGDVIADYVGSGPLKDTGLHRYVLLIYKQPNKLTVDMPHISNNERAGRPSFAIRNFANKFNLSEPLAGNMFQAQYDDYVPTIHKQMGMA